MEKIEPPPGYQGVGLIDAIHLQSQVAQVGSEYSQGPRQLSRQPIDHLAQGDGLRSQSQEGPGLLAETIAFRIQSAEGPGGGLSFLYSRRQTIGLCGRERGPNLAKIGDSWVSR